AISRVNVDGGSVTYVVRGKGDALAQYRLEDLDVTVTGGATQLAFKGDAKVQPGALALKISDGVMALAAGKPITEAALRVTVTLGRGVHVQLADLGIKTLPLEKVLVDYLCQGYAITGPLDLTGGLAFEAADMLNTLTGPGQMKVGRGKVVGSQALALIGSVVRVGSAVSALLSADLPTNMFGSPLEFDSITGTYQITNGTAVTKDLLYTSRAMKVLIAGD